MNGLVSLLNRIRRDSDLVLYLPLCFQFLEYVRNTSLMKFRVRGVDTVRDYEEVGQDVEYIHRWTRTYRRGWLAKMYLVEQWFASHQCPVTMLTLTTYQDGCYSQQQCGRKITREESFELLNQGWNHISKILRKELGHFEYLWVNEPHASGYPHKHVALFCDVTLDVQDKIQRLWSENYGIGSADHGVDFTLSKSRTDIKSLRNYLMKYLSKGFLETGSRFGDIGLSPGELVFNVISWKYGYRLFGSSQGLSQVMKYQKKRSPVVEWVTTELITPAGDTLLVWKSPRCDELVKKGLFVLASTIDTVDDCAQGLTEHFKTEPGLESESARYSEQVTFDDNHCADLTFSRSGLQRVSASWGTRVSRLRRALKKRLALGGGLGEEVVGEEDEYLSSVVVRLGRSSSGLQPI